MSAQRRDVVDICFPLFNHVVHLMGDLREALELHRVVAEELRRSPALPAGGNTP
jgi:hypothetical protein